MKRYEKWDAYTQSFFKDVLTSYPFARSMLDDKDEDVSSEVEISSYELNDAE